MILFFLYISLYSPQCAQESADTPLRVYGDDVAQMQEAGRSHFVGVVQMIVDVHVECAGCIVR